MFPGLYSTPSRRGRSLVLVGEALENRRQLSTNALLHAVAQSVGVPDEHRVSHLVAPSSQQAPSQFTSEIVVESPIISQVVTPLDASVSVESDSNSPESIAAHCCLDGPQFELVVAVLPDEDVDPLVDVPGLDETFLLPDVIDFDFEIDFLDGLIFDTRITHGGLPSIHSGQFHLPRIPTGPIW